jgi:hypothetical protein
MERDVTLSVESMEKLGRSDTLFLDPGRFPLGRDKARCLAVRFLLAG